MSKIVYKNKKQHRGIEPLPSEWKPEALPLHQCCINKANKNCFFFQFLLEFYKTTLSFSNIYDNIITLYWNARICDDSYYYTFFWIYKNSINLNQLNKIKYFSNQLNIKIMNNLTKYFSTAPVVAFISLSLISGLIIEVNRYFPDPLIFAF